MTDLVKRPPRIMYSTVESMTRYLENTECIREFEDVKEVPPMAIIYVHSLMERAWTWKRIVPWRIGYVSFEDYIVYLNAYFERNISVPPDVCAVAERCLEMENKYVKSRRRGGPLTKKDACLSDKIIKMAKNIRDSESSSITVAASLMCIAEEAILMSNLASDHKMFKFSNKVRRYASKLMMYEGPEYRSVAAGMLGMAEEARIACGLLLKAAKKDIESYARLEVCKEVRKCSLDLLKKLKRTFAREACYDISEKSADDNFAGNKNSMDITEGYGISEKSADDNFAGNKKSMDINENKKRKAEVEDSEGMAVSSPLRP